MKQTSVRMDKQLVNRLKAIGETIQPNISISDVVLVLERNYKDSIDIAHNLDGDFIKGDTIEFYNQRLQRFSGDICTWTGSYVNNGIPMMKMSDGVDIVKNGRECFFSRTVRRASNIEFSTKIKDDLTKAGDTDE